MEMLLFLSVFCNIFIVIWLTFESSELKNKITSLRKDLLRSQKDLLEVQRVQKDQGIKSRLSSKNLNDLRLLRNLVSFQLSDIEMNGDVLGIIPTIVHKNFPLESEEIYEISLEYLPILKYVFPDPKMIWSMTKLQDSISCPFPIECSEYPTLFTQLPFNGPFVLSSGNLKDKCYLRLPQGHEESNPGYLIFSVPEPEGPFYQEQAKLVIIRTNYLSLVKTPMRVDEINWPI